VLGEAGARLAFTYQNPRVNDELKRLTESFERPILLPCDVTREDEIRAVFTNLAREMGRLHILVHSIAFARREDLGGEFIRTAREGFLLAIEVSTYSLLALARHAAPLMEEEGGSIVTLTFQASDRVFPGYNVMGTAKAALENVVRQLAAELGPSNIRVNAISPGPLDTLSARAIPRFHEMKRGHAQWAPLKRNVTHHEVAKAALFLCSDLASGITGAIIPVDAGFNIMGAVPLSPDPEAGITDLRKTRRSRRGLISNTQPNALSGY